MKICQRKEKQEEDKNWREERREDKRVEDIRSQEGGERGGESH